MAIIHDLALFGRVAMALGLGFVVGWEREVRGHPAGARTFGLVCAASAALTAVGVDAFPATAEKVIAGVVTGIGFIGAGVVLRDSGGHVRGITTAAAVWSVATLGIVAGAGRFVLAGLTTVAFVVLLELRLVPGLRLLDPRRWSHLFPDDDDPPVP